MRFFTKSATGRFALVAAIVWYIIFLFRIYLLDIKKTLLPQEVGFQICSFLGGGGVE